MKTTIYLPDDLYRRAKAKAALERKTMRDFLSEALERKLAGRDHPAQNPEPESWLGKLPEVPAGAAKEVRGVIDAPNFRSIDESMWK